MPFSRDHLKSAGDHIEVPQRLIRQSGAKRDRRGALGQLPTRKRSGLAWSAQYEARSRSTFSAKGAAASRPKARKSLPVYGSVSKAGDTPENALVLSESDEERDEDAVEQEASTCFQSKHIILGSKAFSTTTYTIEFTETDVDMSPLFPHQVKVPVNDIATLYVHSSGQSPYFFAIRTHNPLPQQSVKVHYDPTSGDFTKGYIVVLLDSIQFGAFQIALSIAREQFGGVYDSVEEIRDQQVKEMGIDIVLPMPSAVSRRSSRLRRKDRSLSASASDRILTVYPPGTIGAVTVHESDLLCLQPQEYLNDNIIDVYLQYLVRQRCTEEQRQRVHIFNSFFYKKLSSKSVVGPHERHDLVKNWTKAVDLFSTDIVIIPVNEHMHWKLILVCNLSNMEQALYDRKLESRLYPRILSLDSLGGRSPHVMTTIRNYLRFEWNTRKSKHVSLTRDGAKDVILASVVKTPIQNNYHDCGIYILEYASRFLAEFASTASGMDPSNTDRRAWFTASSIRWRRTEIISVLQDMAVKR